MKIGNGRQTYRDTAYRPTACVKSHPPEMMPSLSHPPFTLFPGVLRHSSLLLPERSTMRALPSAVCAADLEMCCPAAARQYRNGSASA